MTKRKSGKDLRKEYSNILLKQARFEARLLKRVDELIPQYPDVVYSKGQFKDADHMTVSDYQQYYIVTPEVALTIIEKIEQHIADQHPHQQQDLFVVPEAPVGERVLVNGKTGEAFTRNPEQKDFIEYQDKDDNYQPPERKIENEILDIRLYCMHENCMTYIKGQEGYNGIFHAETGQYCDLRNHGFKCKKHGNDV